MTKRRQVMTKWSDRKGLVATLLVTAAISSGCVVGSDESAPENVAKTAQAAFVLLGNIYQNGTLVSFENITNITGVDMTKIVGLTACGPKTLYAVDKVTVPLTQYRLWFSKDSGQNWTRAKTNDGVILNARSAEIACDHAQLATLDSNKDLWVTPLMANGNSAKNLGADTWTLVSSSVKVDRIQGGDGSIYGVKVVGSGKDVYVASARSINAPLVWGSPIANIGATQVTGTGLKVTGTDGWLIGHTLSWPQSAYALEANGTIVKNRTLLADQNLWSAMNTGTERYLTLTAAAPNILFGIQDKNGVKQINRIRIDETSCWDGVDNDANGMKDSEDPACAQPVASTFCQSHSDGHYCGNRFQPATFLDQTNQNSSRIHCVDHALSGPIERGVCVQNGVNQDYLAPWSTLVAPDPAFTGRYCNVHWQDGSWGFGWTGTSPCTDVLNSKPSDPTGRIVRAGLYSTNAANHVLVKCSNGSYMTGATGVAPLQNAYNAVGWTTNRCVFQVSAGALPFFDQLFVHELPYVAPTWRTTGPFTHNLSAVTLDQFAMGDTGSGFVDRFGDALCKVGDDGCGFREAAYDHPIDEGRPVYAPANGIVITNGSRERDVSLAAGGSATTYQEELYVAFSVGSSATYRETFVVYYAHVRTRLVFEGQTVKAGQILGYVGASGATGGYGHLHTHVHRLSNTNIHTAAMPELGYQLQFYPGVIAGPNQLSFMADNDGTGNNVHSNTAIDPLGWANGSAYDPWAYTQWDASYNIGAQNVQGIGAWSVNLFKTDKAFHYPYL